MLTEAELWLRNKGFEPRPCGSNDDFSVGRVATGREAAPVPQRPDRQSGQREQRALIREEYIVKFGFAIPNAAAIKAIQKRGPIVEVGSGSGYWAYELGKAGMDVVATDSQPGEYAAFSR